MLKPKRKFLSREKIKQAYKEGERNFSNIICKEVDFSKVNLSGCSFKNSDLSFCGFQDADMSDCDFTDVNFQWSGFNRANMKRSNFTRADFQWSILNDAKLDGAILRETNLNWTLLFNVDIEKAAEKDTAILNTASFNPSDITKEGCEILKKEVRKLTGAVAFETLFLTECIAKNTLEKAERLFNEEENQQIYNGPVGIGYGIGNANSPYSIKLSQSNSIIGPGKVYKIKAKHNAGMYIASMGQYV